MKLTLTIFGAPRTKKNSRQHFRPGARRRVVPMPSKAWLQWVQSCYFEVDNVVVRPPLAGAVEINCRAIFYRDARRGDACGYYQGLADLLEKRGVVENDSQLVSWDGSRLMVDKANPRVEVVLESVED